MSRNITILASLQLLVVILGFFGLAIVLKVAGYPGDPPFMRSIGMVVWSSPALILRQYGLLLILVPIIWTVFASCSQNRGNFIFSLDAWLIIGVINSITIMGLFIYVCIHHFAVVDNPLNILLPPN